MWDAIPIYGVHLWPKSLLCSSWLTLCTLYVHHLLYCWCSVFFGKFFLVSTGKRKCSQFCHLWQKLIYIFIIILNTSQWNCMCTYVCLPENLSAVRGPGLCFVLPYMKFFLIKFLKYSVVSLYLWNLGPLIFSFHQIKQVPNNNNVFTHYVWTTEQLFCSWRVLIYKCFVHKCRFRISGWKTQSSRHIFSWQHAWFVISVPWYFWWGENYFEFEAFKPI